MPHIFLLQSSLRYAATAFALCYCAASCRAADWPQPIVPPKVESPSTIKPIAPPAPVLAPITSSKVESPSTIGTPSLSSVPGIVSGPNVAALQGADPHRAALPGLLEQMNNGKLLPQKAWDDKLINVDDLLWLFSSYIGPWGNLGAQKNVEVRRALAKLLIENGGAKLQPIEKLPPTVRLWIADYYQGLGDEKCIALCEGILGEFKAPVKGENALIFQAIERMGWFYNAKKQHEKASQSWLQMASLHSDIGWWTPDAIVEAARSWMYGGDVEKAKELYAKVPAYNQDWFTGLATWDQTDALIQERKFDDALLLIQQALTSNKDNRMRAIFSAQMGYTFYRTGEFEPARKYCRQAVEIFDALKEPPTMGTKSQVSNARNILQQIEEWTKEPLNCLPRKIQGWAKPDVVLKKQFAVRSFRPVPVTASCEREGVKVTVSPNLQKDREFYSHVIIEVEVAPESVGTGFDAVIIVQSPKFPDYEATLPLHVEPRQQLRPAP